MEASRGHVTRGFEGVARAMEWNVAEHGEVGAAVCVFVRGECVVDLVVGHADPSRRRRWEPRTLVDVYSVAKPLVAMLVLQLVDAGRIGLDDAVAGHWPAFGAAGKHECTVRHMLSHRAGVPAIRRPLTNDDLWDLETMLDAVAEAEPWSTPGTRVVYHTNTYGHLIAGLLRATTGNTPGELLDRALATRWDADIHLGLGSAEIGRCAEVVWDGPPPVTVPDDVWRRSDDAAMVMLGYANPPGYSSMGVVNDEQWRRAEVPSTNVHASARGVAIAYRELLAGSLLSPDLLAEATRIQVEGDCPVLDRRVAFGLGFQRWSADRPLGLGPGSFGHFGTGGSLGFADPDHGVAFGYVMNHVVPRWRSPRNAALLGALDAALGSRR